MTLLMGILLGTMFNWQEKFHYCKNNSFEGKYCETAYSLHKEDVESGNCVKRREDFVTYCTY